MSTSIDEATETLAKKMKAFLYPPAVTVFDSNPGSGNGGLQFDPALAAQCRKQMEEMLAQPYIPSSVPLNMPPMVPICAPPSRNFFDRLATDSLCDKTQRLALTTIEDTTIVAPPASTKAPKKRK